MQQEHINSTKKTELPQIEQELREAKIRRMEYELLPPEGRDVMRMIFENRPLGRRKNPLKLGPKKVV